MYFGLNSPLRHISDRVSPGQNRYFGVYRSFRNARFVQVAEFEDRAPCLVGAENSAASPDVGFLGSRRVFRGVPISVSSMSDRPIFGCDGVLGTDRSIACGIAVVVYYCGAFEDYYDIAGSERIAR